MIDQKPFRPLAPQVVDPYDFLHQGEHELNLKNPVIGLDGGILLNAEVIDDLPIGMLKSYLQRRTAITGALFAVTHDPDGNPIIHRQKRGTKRTSRGIPYYSPNIRFNSGCRNERGLVLFENVTENAQLVAQWPSIYKTMKCLNYEDQWRILSTVLQNIATDLIGTEYTHSVTSVLNNEFCQSNYSRAVLDAATLYYRVLQGNMVQRDEEMFMLRAAIDAPRHFTHEFERNVTHLDDVRTRRETDVTYQTLSAARTFLNEFGPGKDLTVIVPRLGAYDLAPALQAVGFKGRLTHVTTSIKMERQKMHSGDIAQRQVSESIQDSDVLSQLSAQGVCAGDRLVVFDDSFASGGTMGRIFTALHGQEVDLRGIRTMYRNTQRDDNSVVEQAMGVDGLQLVSYYELPIRQPTGEDQQFLVPRVFTERWQRQQRSQ